MLSHVGSDGRFVILLMFCLYVALAIVVPALSKATEPESVDLRPGFYRWGLPPRAQGGRPTCSVFVVTGAIEYSLADKQHQGTRLSVEFLNWASNRAIRKRVDGGFFSDLWKGFEAYGICNEDDMPYVAIFDPSQQPSSAAREHARQIQEAGLRLHWIKKWNPHKGLTEGQFLAVKKTLRRWPVCGGFLWPKKAEWTDGVLEMAPRQGVRDGHSVLLVGFRDDPDQPGGGVFLVRNSSKGPRDGASRSADQRSMSYEYVRAYMNDALWIDYDGASSSRREHGTTED